MSHEAAGGHAHDEHVAHHFDTAEQQMESGKLGMWLFLAQELLFFGGVFCAYAIFRAHNPELFSFGSSLLNWKLGGLNTIVLICSSLTMAWAVRCAQVGQKKLLLITLALTQVFAGGFLVVKYFEYAEKVHHGFLWGTLYQPDEHALNEYGWTLPQPEAPAEAPMAPPPAAEPGGAAPSEEMQPDAEPAAASRSGTGAVGLEVLRVANAASDQGGGDHGKAAEAGHAKGGAGHGGHGGALAVAPVNGHLFFGIYFVMTGLHLLHVLAGMAVIGWLMLGAWRGVYGPAYFNPVDIVGLYWHLVDLIWIFLFPLLYLIH